MSKYAGPPIGGRVTLKYVFAVSHERGIFFMYRIDNNVGWCADRACDMYRSLRAALGNAGTVVLYEDNGARNSFDGLRSKLTRRCYLASDPVWKISGPQAEKASCGFAPFPGGTPKRSPDLNPLDYAIGRA